jgi:hypothetical protein
VSETGGFQLMSRLERAAADVAGDLSASQVVRDCLVALIEEDDPCVAPFVAKLLGGGLGEEAAHVGWREVAARGIIIAGANTDDPDYTSFASRCMFRGRLDILREVVLRVPLEAVPLELRPPERFQLLDLMSTTSEEREHPSFEGVDACMGLVGLAAWNSRFCPHATEALELAWEVNPKHDGFDVFADDASQEGSFVRAFLIRKGIEEASARDVVPSRGAARRRRIAL